MPAPIVTLSPSSAVFIVTLLSSALSIVTVFTPAFPTPAPSMFVSTRPVALATFSVTLPFSSMMFESTIETSPSTFTWSSPPFV